MPALLTRLEASVAEAVARQVAVAVLWLHVTPVVAGAGAEGVTVGLRSALHRALHPDDAFVSLGHGHFVVVRVQPAGPAALVLRRLHVLGRRIQRELEHPLTSGPAGASRASIGLVVTSRDHPAADLVRSAERAMRTARARGGGQLVLGTLWREP
jgi:GGDEF domain-containing protein